MFTLVIGWWILPSMICLFLFLQLRHINNETMYEFLLSIKNENIESTVAFILIIWPLCVIMLLGLIIYLLVDIFEIDLLKEL